MGHASTEHETELIQQCLSGDRVAQYRLYKQYAQPMFNVCVRFVPDTTEAEDLLQESFVKVFRELRTFQGTSTLGAWLKRIVINHCLNHLRKKRPVFQELSNVDLPETDDGESFWIEITSEQIHHAIKRLPEGARVVCVLYLLEGYKHAAIAELLGISESTSKSQYRRAIGLLKADLANR